MEISFTRFRVYLECPWKYKLLFVDGRRIPLSPASSLGVSLHRALERYHRERRGELRELLDCLDHEWLHAGYPDAETKLKWHGRARRILERYHEGELERRSEIVGVEREFVYPLGRHEVRGMIDRIDRQPDGRFEVIDYKTAVDVRGDSLPASPAEHLQLRFYALGARECLAVSPAILTLHYLAAGRRDSAPYDPAGEEELKETIAGVASRIEAGRWSPDTGFCPRCDFRRACAFSVAKD